MKPPCKFKVGDKVDVARWDKTERPPNRVGSPATVTGIESKRCESGWMVSIQGPSGEINTLDQNWLKEWQ